MAALADVRAAIKTTLESVADIGQVHDYERYASRQGDFVALYYSAGHAQIRGWNFRRVAREERSSAIGRHAVTARWALRGYMALDDSAASEQTFDLLVEALIAAFRADDSLGGVVDTCIIADVAGLQLDEAGPVMLAGVLCHGARLTLRTRWYL